MDIPLQNRKGEAVTEARQNMHKNFKKVGVAPETYVLDNELSQDLIEDFESELVQHQLVTPFRHKKINLSILLDHLKLISKYA